MQTAFRPTFRPSKTEKKQKPEPLPSRVIVADTSYLSRYTMATALRSIGCEVHEAEDGEEGLNLTRLLMPDLVVMETFMGTSSGLEALARIRREDAIAKVPVILVSVFASAAVVSRAMQAGASDFLIKPVSMDTLKERAGMHLGLMPAQL